MAKVQLAKVQMDSKSHILLPNTLQGGLLLARCCNLSGQALLISAEKSPWSSQMFAPDHPKFDAYSDPANQHLSQGRGFTQQDDYNSQQLVVPFNLIFFSVQLQIRGIAADITAKAAGQVP